MAHKQMWGEKNQKTMSLNMTTKKVISSLTHSIDKALLELLSLPYLKQDQKNEIFHFNSQLENLYKDYRLNLISNEERTRRLDKIRFSVLEFIHCYEKYINDHQDLSTAKLIDSNIEISKDFDTIEFQKTMNRLGNYFNVFTIWMHGHDGEGSVNSKIEQHQFRLFVSQEKIMILFDYETRDNFKYDLTDEEREEFVDECCDFESFKYEEFKIEFEQKSIQDVQVLELGNLKTLDKTKVFKLRFISKELGQIRITVNKLMHRHYYKDQNQKVIRVEYSKEEGNTEVDYVEYFDLWVDERYADLLRDKMKSLIK